MSFRKANDEGSFSTGRGNADERESVPKEGMGGVDDSDKVTDLIHHCGIVLCLSF